MVCSCIVNTPIGEMRASAENGKLSGLWFVGQKYYPAQSHEWPEDGDCPVFGSLRGWLSDYFAGKNPAPAIDLEPGGTDFQKSVWAALLKIPYGTLATYGEIAKQVGCKCARAIGGAVGHNPISILIPCHRVIGSNGDLTGYAGGIGKKEALLSIERARFTVFA